MKEITEKFLKHLDRIFKTDTSYLIGGGFWSIAGKILTMLTAFVLSIAYARYLLKDVYGDYRYVFSLLGMVGVFTLPGIGLAITRSVARGFSATFPKIGKIIFLSSFGITIVGLIGSYIYYSAGNSKMALALFIAALFIPFVEGLGSWRAYLDGKKDFKRKVKYNIIIQLVTTVLMLSVVFAIYFLQLSAFISVSLLVGTYVITRGTANIILFPKLSREVPKKSAPESGAVRYGVHLSAGNILSSIATYIDNVLLFHFLGPVSVAVYSFSILIPEQMKSVLASVANIILPKLSEKTLNPQLQKESKKTISGKMLKASMVALVFVTAYIALAPYIFEIFFPRYIESVVFSQVFVLPLIFLPFTFLGSALVAEANLKKIYTFKITSSIIQIVALLILIPLYGIWGAVFGRVIGRMTRQMLLYALYKIN